MRPYQLALTLSTALLAHAAAHAAEVTLFSGPDLSGQVMTVRGDVNTLKNMGFNDRAMSMVVHSGRWEMCTDANFRGECRVYEEGQYRNLDRFTRQLSSVRQLEAERERGQGRGRGRGRGRDDAGVMLFDGTDLRGRSALMNRDSNNLFYLGFDDKIQSMAVRGGTWEFCQHPDFTGDCRVFGPGEYRNLDRAFHRSISSARRVDGQDGRGQYDRRDDYGRGNEQGVTLFDGTDLRGRAAPLTRDSTNLFYLDFDDKIQSMSIRGGTWEFCQHPDYTGECRVFGPGDYRNLDRAFHRSISSARRVDGQNGRPRY